MNVIRFGESNTYGYNPRSRLGIRFADAGDWNIPIAYDGVHFAERGHRAFAAGLLEVLK